MVQVFVTVLSMNLKPINYHVLDCVQLYLRHYEKKNGLKKFVVAFFASYFGG